MFVLISPYNEAGLIQKCKNSTHRVAMVSGGDDASAVRQSSSGSCLSSSDLLSNRRASCHGSEEPSERPPLVVDHGMSFWTTRSRRPLTVGLYRSRRGLRTVVLTNVADEHVLFWPTLLMNTCCSDQRRWWTRADLTDVADEHVLFWPTSLMIPYGEDDEPRGPRGRATDRWRWHLSSTTTTGSRRRRR